MSFDLNAVDPTRAARVAPQRPGGPPPAARGGFAEAMREQGPAAHVDAIPASPPPEVLQEMLAAQKAYADMHSRGRQLHFEMTNGRVKVELQDLDGNVLREIPASRALEAAGGRLVQ